jgi:Putative methyltransferase
LVSQRDWFEWHRPYDDPSSPLSRRLLIIQGEIRAAIDRAPMGPVRAVSMCAGQGRDLIGALADHPRRSDVIARLVEMDFRNVEVAQAAARTSGLTGITVQEDDASMTDAYKGAAPADIVLACGVFGNIDEEDIRATIRTLPQLCAPRATVIWTRHRQAPDLTQRIRGWFADSGFEEVVFHAPDDAYIGIGVHRLDATPVPLRIGHRMFEFVGSDALQP